MSFAGSPVTAINTNRLQSLAAYLILHADAPQPRERLAFLLWRPRVNGRRGTNLRQLLHHLKRAFDQRRRFTVSFVYDLGFLAQAMKTWPKRVTGGWQLSGIYTLAGGFPATPFWNGATPVLAANQATSGQT